MPAYQHIILTLPKATPESLANLVKRYSNIIFANQGVVRGVENHGVRSLPERTRRKYPTVDGERYFWNAHYLTITFDGRPQCLVEADRMLKSDEIVLRHIPIKYKSALDRANGMTYKNPYLSVNSVANK